MEKISVSKLKDNFFFGKGVHYLQTCIEFMNRPADEEWIARAGIDLEQFIEFSLKAYLEIKTSTFDEGHKIKELYKDCLREGCPVSKEFEAVLPSVRGWYTHFRYTKGYKVVRDLILNYLAISRAYIETIFGVELEEFIGIEIPIKVNLDVTEEEVENWIEETYELIPPHNLGDYGRTRMQRAVNFDLKRMRINKFKSEEDCLYHIVTMLKYKKQEEA